MDLPLACMCKWGCSRTVSLIAKRNVIQRATKYVKYGNIGSVETLIKGKPLLTWGLTWMFH